MKKHLDAVVLLFSDSYGIYIPQAFAESCENWHGMKQEDKEILLTGPEHDDYWDAWDTVLQDAYYLDGNARYMLHQDGDLWAVCPERMTNEEHENIFGEMKPAPNGAYEYEVCHDCLIALANDDYTGIESDRHAKHVADSLAALMREYRHVIPDGAEYGFSNDRCECCGALPGNRYRVLCFND